MLFWLQIDSESAVAGKAAIGNLLGGVGYFYGQSKIARPKDSNVSNSNVYSFLFSFCPFSFIDASFKPRNYNILCL